MLLLNHIYLGFFYWKCPENKINDFESDQSNSTESLWNYGENLNFIIHWIFSWWTAIEWNHFSFVFFIEVRDTATLSLCLQHLLACKCLPLSPFSGLATKANEPKTKVYFCVQCRFLYHRMMWLHLVKCWEEGWGRGCHENRVVRKQWWRKWS